MFWWKLYPIIEVKEEKNIYINILIFFIRSTVRKIYWIYNVTSVYT